MSVLIIQRLAIQFFLDFLYFPLWWYSFGLVRGWNTAVQFIHEGNQQFVPFLWLKHLFVPMFGQYDWQGRIMSVFVRFGNVIVRLIGLCIWTFVVLVLFFVWVSLPLLLLSLLVLSFVS